MDRARVLLSVQGALLGAITPEMRAIDVCWNEKEIRLRFTLDARGKGLDLDDIYNTVEAEIEGDFLPDARVTSEATIVPDGDRISEFNPLHGGTARVFARKETDD